MRVFISADIEGITGVAAHEDSAPGGSGYEQARALMHGDVNAAIEGAVAAGADAVLVKDGHGNLTNLQRERLDDQARLIRGPDYSEGMLQGLTAEHDVLFFVGYHAKSGTVAAVLNHTFLFDEVVHLRVNGEEVGELSWNARLAAELGVAVGLVTGDDKSVEEGRSELGDTETVTVKTGLSRFSADCRPAEETQAEIRKTAERAVERAAAEDFNQPVSVDTPVRVEVDWLATNRARSAARGEGVVRVNGLTTAIETETYEEAFELGTDMILLGT